MVYDLKFRVLDLGTAKFGVRGVGKQAGDLLICSLL